ncbi:MAG: bifunctional adenosylcobinamide kinase/adenosylcobinamide-phosphate guanylyltransferase [Chlorobiaceae bacterium]|nr:bifunctional adenosylcobinamide kinase/adenosylcobinamide-phosphate guanylyltransferase [Chlorobiaceae bacterium]
MSKIIYVTGGARSGKSSYALRIADDYRNRVFLATAEPFDEEMERRIERHREERHDTYLTLEEPVYLERSLKELPPGCDVVLLDCLTVWAGNLMHHFGTTQEIEERIEAFLDVISSPPCDMVLVSNEVGMGIVPENSMARMFRDIAGTINQKVASLSDEAYLLCSGMPLKLK